jgi:hypothetical protein
MNSIADTNIKTAIASMKGMKGLLDIKPTPAICFPKFYIKRFALACAALCFELRATGNEKGLTSL